MTPGRIRLIELLYESKKPLTASDILTSILVHKTTIYREINVLTSRGYIQEVDFGDGNRRYELSALGHHHHLICMQCKGVTELELTHDFKNVEKRVLAENKFTIVKHNLEFFGVCADCS